MGVFILEGKKVNEGPHRMGAVLYCSTSGQALPPMFENSAEAERFLAWLEFDPREYSHARLLEKLEAWRGAGRPALADPLDADEDPD